MGIAEIDKPIANPLFVLREEFDDWAVLFHPDTGNTVGLNPVSVFIWKLLDGSHTVSDILKKLRENCEDVPEEAEAEIKEFIDSLTTAGFIGHEIPKGDPV